jgi:hypothetical protein
MPVPPSGTGATLVVKVQQARQGKAPKGEAGDGIELKTTLKARKLLILLNAKNAKNTGFAQVRYTPGTRR